MVEHTEINGDYTNAKVFLPEEEIEDSCYEQIQNIVDHEAFTEPVRVMPDAHWGAGCVIGFSMPLTDKVIPNVVGLDIGCAMSGIKIDNLNIDSHDKLDKEIRETIPMGFEVNSFDDAINIKDEFPWEEMNKKFLNFKDSLGEDIEFDGYDIDYFKELCNRIDYDTTRAIKSVGSLGGSNHFIEFCVDKNNRHWVVVHSGSRGIGKAIAEYWQDKAIENRKQDNIEQSSNTFKRFVENKYEEYVNNDLTFNKEKIREDFEGEQIDKVFGHLGNAKSEFEQEIKGDLNYVDELAYLEGDEAHGYYIDMIFAQTYASMSRKKMLEDIVDILDADIVERIETVHNYIDFDDLTIRKGSCNATDSSKILIPFNMRDGAIIARGKGNREWNNTAPHGAGRNMGRREAHRNLEFEDMKSEMENVEGKFTEDMLDEAPMAYKNTDLIKKQIEPTAEVINKLEVVHNIKAD